MDEHDTNGEMASEKNIGSDEEMTSEENNDFEEELTHEEVVNEVDDKVNAILELLIEKGIINQEEVDKKIESFYEDDDESSESDGSCSDSTCNSCE